MPDSNPRPNDPEPISKNQWESSGDGWKVDLHPGPGMDGDAFLRLLTIATMLQELLDQSPFSPKHSELSADEALEGRKYLATHLSNKLLSNLTTTNWDNVDETWEQWEARKSGVSRVGVDSGNSLSNLEAAYNDRFQRWRNTADSESAMADKLGFTLGVLERIQLYTARAEIETIGNRPLGNLINAQFLVELWHECHLMTCSFFRTRADKITQGMQAQVIDWVVKKLNVAPPETISANPEEYRRWMRKIVHPAYYERYRQLSGQFPNDGIHLTQMSARPTFEPLQSLAKGRGQTPASAIDLLQEALMGKEIQVLHEAEGGYMFLGQGFVNTLLCGFDYLNIEDVKILQLRHEYRDSLAIFIPLNGGGWIILPMYWSGRGSQGPRRIVELEAAIDPIRDRITWATIEIGERDFIEFLSTESNTGTPIWLRDHSVAATRLHQERRDILPRAQSLILELLCYRHVSQQPELVWARDSEPGPSGQEIDVVAMVGDCIHMYECENTVHRDKLQDLIQEIDAKSAFLRRKYCTQVTPHLVTREASLKVDSRIDARTFLENAGIRVLTLEQDLYTGHKKHGSDRWDAVFPPLDQDPWLNSHAVTIAQMKILEEE